MQDNEYVRTRTISKRIGGVVVTLMETGDVTTVILAKNDAKIEVFADSIADIAKGVRAMQALLNAEE